MKSNKLIIVKVNSIVKHLIVKNNEGKWGLPIGYIENVSKIVTKKVIVDNSIVILYSDFNKISQVHFLLTENEDNRTYCLLDIDLDVEIDMYYKNNFIWADISNTCCYLNYHEQKIISEIQNYVINNAFKQYNNPGRLI